MVIDVILDRYDGQPYSPREFYYDMMQYGAGDISAALDYGDEADIKKRINEYILNNGYNPKICNFVNSCLWLTPDKGKHYIDFIKI